MAKMLLRIGALSGQTGVSFDVLRSWERRYALLKPARTPGGFRLYTTEDRRRVLMVKELIGAGASAAQAALQVLSLDTVEIPGAPTLGTSPADECRSALSAAFRSFSGASIEAAVDMILSRLDLDTAIATVFIPALRTLGDDWAEGRVTIGQEHLAVNALRGRLLGLARGWDRGFGPRVLLACPPGEYHDISLVLFGLALRHRGWRVTFLGADTPLETILEVSKEIKPRLTVLYSAQWPERAELAPSLARLSSPPTALAGATGEEVAATTGLRWLSGDPVGEAESLTRELERSNDR